MKGKPLSQERLAAGRAAVAGGAAGQQAVAGKKSAAAPAAPASTLPGGAPPAATVTSQMDPTLSRQLARYDERFTRDPTRRAIQQSTLGISDAAALSAADAKGMMSRRGTLGTGAGDTYLRKHVFDPAQRQAAGAAASIATQRERDLDNLVVSGTPLATAPGAQAIQQQNLALNTQGQAFNQRFTTDEAEWRRSFEAEEAQRRADEEAARQMAALYSPYLSGQQVPAGIPIPGSVQATPRRPYV